MVLTLTFCFLASSWRALRADSSSLNEAVAVFGLVLYSASVQTYHVISLPQRLITDAGEEPLFDCIRTQKIPSLYMQAVPIDSSDQDGNKSASESTRNTSQIGRSNQGLSPADQR